METITLYNIYPAHKLTLRKTANALFIYIYYAFLIVGKITVTSLEN
jgi:hypothetical protein